MFDPKQSYWYTLINSKPGNPAFDSKFLTEKKLYKFKCKNKVVYHIVVEVYNDLYFFLKYYPSRMQESPNKYKIRTNTQKDFSKIIGTCAKLTSNLIKERPDAIFGFVGQWDNVDVENKTEISQRYSLYRKISPNLFPKEKYGYMEVKHLNMMIFTLLENINLKLNKKIKKDFEAFLATPEATSLIMPTLLSESPAI